MNGQFLDIENGAYQELGAAGTPSSTIEILSLPGGGLVVGDSLEFRLGGGGGGGGGGGVGPAGPAGPTGPQGPAGFNAAGGPVPVSTKFGSYSSFNKRLFFSRRLYFWKYYFHDASVFWKHRKNLVFQKN